MEGSDATDERGKVHDLGRHVSRESRESCKTKGPDNVYWGNAMGDCIEGMYCERQEEVFATC